MKKTEFLALLRQRISILPKREIEETLAYYSEMIDDYIESGYTPEAAVAKMGGVENVAAQILAGSQNATFDAPVVKKQRKSGLVIALLILGFPLWLPLLITAFAVLLTLAIVLATLAIVLPWSLVVAFGASALGLLVVTPIVLIGEGIAALLFTVGGALVVGSLCIFCLWVGLRLTGWIVRVIGAMFKGFFKLLFGRR